MRNAYAWVPERPPPAWAQAAVAVAAVGGATALRLLLGDRLGMGVPFITFFPAVLIATVWGGALAGGATLAASAVIAARLFLAPDGLDEPDIWALVAFGVSAGLMVAVGAALVSAVRAQAATQQRFETVETELRTLISELGHRAKNGIAVVIAIVSQSARGAATPQECADLIIARLTSMSDAQDAVTEAGGVAVGLRELLRKVLAPFDIERIDLIEDEPTVVEREVAGALALLAHELATNAVKYGALSVEGGRVEIRIARTPGQASAVWREIGGPPVSPAARKGFGTRLITTALAGQGGHAELTFPEDGAVCTMTFPLAKPD